MEIKKNDKIYDLLIQYPFLKQKLIVLNKTFENLNNPIMLNSVAKIARIKDIAAISGENLEKLLEFINDEIHKYDTKKNERIHNTINQIDNE